MGHHCQGCVLLLATILVAFKMPYSRAYHGIGNKVKSATFLSPVFVLGPGSVENRFYYNIDFPRGHLAIKSFNGEVVDEAGNPVPLHETYLHHWVVARYYQRENQHQDVASGSNNENLQLHQSDFILVGNSGICQKNTLRQYFGLGSETRRTATYVPDPYGIEVGNPAEIPAGYEERWLVNVHAIDTRGVEDTLGCTDCRCDLYNITMDEYGRSMRPNYRGGLACCHDHSQCKLSQGFEGARRSLYLRYTMHWVDWDSSVIPAKIYIFDVTDTGKRSGKGGYGPENGCQIEYDIQSCNATDGTNSGCIDVQRRRLTMPTGGYVIYGVAHQHSGGIGSTLFGEDGRVICTSLPTYGEGKEAGNESGYIVGMSTCYPKPGSVRISDGENLILESNYSATQMHTGVMGLFYILVADQTPKSTAFMDAATRIGENMKLSKGAWVTVALLGLAITAAVGVRRWLKNGTEDGYQPITA